MYIDCLKKTQWTLNAKTPKTRKIEEMLPVALSRSRVKIK